MHPKTIAARRTTLCKRHDGCGMEIDRAAAASALAARSSPRDQFARDRECDPLHCGHRLPMARAAKGLSAVFDGSVLLLQMARFWLVAHDQRRSGPANARKTGTQSHSFGRDYRQPERENHGKWRSPRV